MPAGHRGKTAAMDTASWKPGTTRWACLITGACCVYLAVSLPLAIAVNTGLGSATAYDHLPRERRPHLHVSGVDELLAMVS